MHPFPQNENRNDAPRVGVSRGGGDVFFALVRGLTRLWRRRRRRRRGGALFGRGRRRAALLPVCVQQVRGPQAGRVEVRELHVLPGAPARPRRGRRAAGRRRRRFRGALRWRHRQRARPSRAQATGAGRLARVPHRRQLFSDGRHENKTKINRMNNVIAVCNVRSGP